MKPWRIIAAVLLVSLALTNFHFTLLFPMVFGDPETDPDRFWWWYDLFDYSFRLVLTANLLLYIPHKEILIRAAAVLMLFVFATDVVDMLINDNYRSSKLDFVAYISAGLYLLLTANIYRWSKPRYVEIDKESSYIVYKRPDNLKEWLWALFSQQKHGSVAIISGNKYYIFNKTDNRFTYIALFGYRQTPDHRVVRIDLDPVEVDERLKAHIGSRLSWANNCHTIARKTLY